MDVFRWLLSGLLILAATSVEALEAPDIEDLRLEQITQWFTGATQLERQVNSPGYRLVYRNNVVQGAVFYSHQVSPIPAYSGTPIATLIALDTRAAIIGLKIVQHEEPILVVGVKEEDLKRFTDQYINLFALDKVRVDASNRPGYVGIDGISSATITAMVLNRSVMVSAKKVALALNWPSQVETMIATQPQIHSEADRWKERLEPWLDRLPTVTALTLALGLLLFILFFQDWLVRKPKIYGIVRIGYMIFTVVFIGYIFSAQLSIVNILAFIQTLSHGFTWDTLMLDPAIFLLWSFIATSILLWGRGVFCGWLCPFGAIQDLIHEAARKLNIPSFEFPSTVHQRLWAIKYFILIALVGISMDSFSTAAIMAEVEPFKTVITLNFAREWGYVAYASSLLVISVFNSKFFCKYLCALGAGLSILGRFRIFDWMRRRNECGKPCQACASLCQNGAIKPTGEIIDNECHFCLECQVAYWDDHTCPPLVEKRKRREKREQARNRPSIIKIIDTSPDS
jgi:NosR/NirI family transcriptional regulator, nitrous oxide reductase regulator